MMIGNSFAERIRAILAEKNISQAVLARRTGISAAAINGYCKGFHHPSAKRIASIAKALDIDPCFLAGQAITFEEDIPDLSSFAGRLNDIIQKKGMSKAELARQSKIPESTMGCYCSGTRVPSPGRISLIAQCLNIDIQEFEGCGVSLQEDKPNLDTFAGRLKAALKKEGISQLELARRTDFAGISIHEYCSGKHLPTAKRVTILAKALNVDIKYLVGSEIHYADYHTRLLTPEEARFAEENYGAVFYFLNKQKIDVDEFYDAVILEYLTAVKRWLSEPKLQEFSFLTILRLAIKSAIYHELKRKKNLREISLYTPLDHDGDGGTLLDVI